MKPVLSSLFVYLVCLILKLNLSFTIAFTLDLTQNIRTGTVRNASCRVTELSYRLDSCVAVQRDDKGYFRTLTRRADDGQTLSVHLGQPAMRIG